MRFSARRKCGVLSRLHRPQAEEMATKLEQGQTLLLENLRFHAEEEANDPEFARHPPNFAITT